MMSASALSRRSSTMVDLSEIPAGTPPPGVVPNFVNPESRAPALVAICILMIVLTVPSVATRFFVRLRISKNPGLDDWIGLLGAVFTLAFTIYAIVVFSLPGNGPHIWNVPLSVYMDPNSKYFLRMLFTQILYPVCAYIIKLSLLIFYARVFVTPGLSKAKLFIYGGAVVMTLVYTVLIVLTIAFCARNPSLIDPNGSCYAKGGQVNWALSGVNIFSDFYTLAIPLFVLSGLQMSMKKKWAVGGIFLIGIFATIASILTLYFRIVLSRGNDIPWDIVPSAICTILELNLGVICSCLPALAALIKSRANLTKNGSKMTGQHSRRNISGTLDGGISGKSPSKGWKRDEYNDSAKLVAAQQYVELGTRTHIIGVYETS